MNLLKEILSNIRPEADFSASTDFLKDGLLDSFDLLMLVADLDQRFEISIEGIEIIPENFQNLQTIEALLTRHGVIL